MRRIAASIGVLLAGTSGSLSVSSPAFADGTSCMVSPTKMEIVSSRFGIYRGAGEHGSAAKNAHMHDGLDFTTGGKAGELYATTDGKVIFRGVLSGFGNSLIIQRSNKETVRYSHLSGYADGIALGTEVKAGQLIGRSGNSGGGHMDVHLHFSYGVPQKQDARATAFHGAAEDIKSLNPAQLPHSFSTGSNLGWKTDPSPYFCKSFPISDGRTWLVDKLGKTTKEQYQNLYGDVPDGGAPPELVAQRIEDAEAADTGKPVADYLDDSGQSTYGALPEPPIGDYKNMSASAMLQTEASRRFMSADWNNEVTHVSQRALLVDYAKAAGVGMQLDNAIREKKQRIEALWAVYVSQKLGGKRQETARAQAQAARDNAVLSVK